MRAEDTGLAKTLCPPMTEEMRKEFLEQLQLAMYAGSVLRPNSNNVNRAIIWAETPQGSIYGSNWDKVTRA